MVKTSFCCGRGAGTTSPRAMRARYANRRRRWDSSFMPAMSSVILMAAAYFALSELVSEQGDFAPANIGNEACFLRRKHLPVISSIGANAAFRAHFRHCKIGNTDFAAERREILIQRLISQEMRGDRLIANGVDIPVADPVGAAFRALRQPCGKRWIIFTAAAVPPILGENA